MDSHSESAKRSFEFVQRVLSIIKHPSPYLSNKDMNDLGIRCTGLDLETGKPTDGKDKEIVLLPCVLDRCVTGGMNSKLPAQHKLVFYSVHFFITPRMFSLVESALSFAVLFLTSCSLEIFHQKSYCIVFFMNAATSFTSVPSSRPSEYRGSSFHFHIVLRSCPDNKGKFWANLFHWRGD